MVTVSRPEGPETVFKDPQFDGKGGVEYFILLFEETIEANGWRPTAAILRLQEALK